MVLDKMRTSAFIRLMLGAERPEAPDGEDHRAIKIQGMPSFIVKGVKEYNNAIVIQIKKKERYDNDRR